jgi:hypothetical protein
MDRVIVTNRLLIVLVFAFQALVLAGCKAKCLSGSTLEGGSCKKIGSEAAAGTELAATAAGVGGDSATPVSTANATQAGSGSEASAGAGASQAMATGQQSASGGSSAMADSSSVASAAEPCDSDGSTRCAPSAPQGTRETCMGKVWAPGASCAASETCVMQDGNAECAAVRSYVWAATVNRYATDKEPCCCATKTARCVLKRCAAPRSSARQELPLVNAPPAWPMKSIAVPIRHWSCAQKTA